MKEPVLSIRDFRVRYSGSVSDAVRGVDMTLREGESAGLIGESGSGKSSLALAALGLLRNRAHVEGSVQFKGMELNGLSESAMEAYRWSRIAIVFQNSLDVLNPVITVGEQIAECIRRHRGTDGAEADERTRCLLERVGLRASWGEVCPHQLSGGMRQKVLVAMALSCDPEVLFVDEPTTALDRAAKQETVRLLLRLQEEKGFAMLVISHELPIVSAMTSRVMVMYAGAIVEEGGTEELLKAPLHPYTRGLISSSPAINPYRDMWGIPGEITAAGERQCPFFDRCNQRIDRCAKELPVLEAVREGRRVACLRKGIVTLLEGSGISKTYSVGKKKVTVCSDCSIEVKAGEVCALIGESGSGKTTLAEILSGISRPCSGRVAFEGRVVRGNSETSRVGAIQIVFQDPLSATNEHLTVEETVREPLDITREGMGAERVRIVTEALKNVQLPFDDAFLKRRCFMLSGGQRQRVAVARALVMRPKLLIADEISAMLDPSTAANLMRLLKGLQNSQGFSMLFITHDLALAQKIADRIYVMHRGEIVAQGSTEDVLGAPGLCSLSADDVTLPTIRSGRGEENDRCGRINGSRGVEAHVSSFPA